MESNAENGEKGLNIWQDGIERGDFMVEFVKRAVLDTLDNRAVLDLGCGMGGISISFARTAAGVVAGDHDLARLHEVKRRVGQEKLYNMRVAKFDGRALPFKDGMFDLVIMNGVLEYLGMNSDGKDPKELQIAALKEARRVLKQGGKLYVGIENRWYPIYVLEDVHSGLPLVTILPRPLASAFSYLVARKPFQMYTHSFWELRSMFEKAGFKRSDFFVPIYNYQYPLAIIPIDDIQGMLKTIDGIDRFRATADFKVMSVGRIPNIKALLLKLVLKLGLIRLLSPCFVSVASR